jgi:hypothetical protein
MSDLHEYIVSTIEGVAIDDLESKLVSPTAGLTHIPDRVIDVANPRLLNERQTHFLLAEEEAELLRNHPDVLDVGIAPTPDMISSCDVQVDNFYRDAGGTAINGGNASYTNWGLRRVNLGTDEVATGVSNYDYYIDGEGVDIVIQDNGTQNGHPEWEDKNGNTRFVQHNWYTVTGYPGTLPTGWYGNVGNHGSHVTGIVSGKHYGWAKGAAIYSMRYELVSNLLDAFDLIRVWHQNKPVDPRTGYKRPTIVNASWGYRWWHYNNNTGAQVSRTYRGTTTVTSAFSSAEGQITAFVDNTGRYGARNFVVASTDIACKQMTDVGVIYIKAAGNYYHKTDSSVNKTILGTEAGNIYQMKHTLTVAAGHAVTAVSGCTVPGGTTVSSVIDHKRVQLNNPITPTSGTIVLNFKGPDYDNYAIYNASFAQGTIAAGQPVYYHRPGSPWSSDSINVGCIDNARNGSSQEQRATFSEHGAGIDVYAPGSNISSSTSNASGYASATDYPYNTTYKIARISGTSMAAPQVTGLLACYLSLNPGATAEDCKEWLASKASVAGQLYDTGLTNDYTNNRSLNSSPGRYLKNPFASPKGIIYNDGITLTGNFTKV